MLQVGDFRIHMINESVIKVDPGGAFGLVPRVLWSPLMPPDENHLVPMIHNCLLVQAGDRNILVDTGHGDKLGDKQKRFMALQRPYGTMTDALARLGLTANDIHLVIDTHLHGDHAGGNTRYDESGKIVAAFPNAEYVVQRREYEDAMKPNERTRATYLPVNYQPLVESGQMRLLDGDTEVVSGIFGHVTPGHTPAHMSIRFESNGEQALFVCDMASYAIHFERLGWMTGYDVEPLVTLETKRYWQQWALETGALLIFAHDPQRAAGHYMKDADGKASVIPVNEPFV
ncbi:MAG: MBL fold metallo-hydrolase [Anaerolineaceae bacterium]|nr:MBL fold metallo-hydrolase [Anaerolineaceae bacterium]